MATLHSLSGWAIDRTLEVPDLQVHRPTLEDIYLTLTEPPQVSDAPLVAHQLRYDLLVDWRNPQSRFFTIVLPVIFLVLLTSLFGNHTTHVNGTRSRTRPSMSRGSRRSESSPYRS